MFYLAVITVVPLVALQSLSAEKLKQEQITKVAVKKKGKTMCNRLAAEKSPYLLQHKDNPVCWYPWGQEAFKRAREENKPIFLSIGYSTCYWCHVMEKDSFEKEDIAELLNKNFISIKVDREERPDIDQIYMDVVVGLTGHGGWPMSVFLTPEREPFWGGTFFPHDQFKEILTALSRAWREEQHKVTSSASKIVQSLRAAAEASVPEQPVSDQILIDALSAMEKTFDPHYGGFGSRPKFPPSDKLMLLLRLYRRGAGESALNMATKTLNAMAAGGIYDHLGGGFHRYATDARWLVPHFEKMLYDNALLSMAYLEAYQLTGNKNYELVVRETLDYVLREMSAPEGGFYSAQDAGEVGKEGEYYTWTYSELKSLLTTEQLKALSDTYQISKEGNFEDGKIILALREPASNWADKYSGELLGALKVLRKERSRRRPPHKDDKILTGWNGLMISAMTRAYRVFSDSRYLNAARDAATLILNKMESKSGLLRRYRDGDARFAATAEDYAYMIQGLLDLYQSDFDIRWYRAAVKLQNEFDARLWDTKAGGYFSGDSDDLIVRKKEFSDGATPSANSVALLNLLKLYALSFDQNFKKRADKLVKVLSGRVATYPAAYPAALVAFDYFLDRSKEVVLVKGKSEKEFKETLAGLREIYNPNCVLAAAGSGITAVPVGEKRPPLGGKTTIYVCENNLCKLPVTDLKQAKKLISDYSAIKAR
ncbi:MAG: thioredoxin domain-containing protein [Candidatus Dadabacteria bacterium]|nr:MAG: thioredoxin domain-containing protein [Candidatus Dadabacteria bacterium]